MSVPKLRFNEFDGDWNSNPLSELANLTSSKRVHLADYVPHGVPFFRGKEITELKSGIFPSDVLYISHSQFNEFKKKFGIPKNNEILITAVGTLANTYLINTNYDFYFKDGNLIWLKDIKANPKFLMILLDAKKKDVLASSIGSTQKALTIANLNKLTFNFPCDSEQTKIASFLSTVDEKISQLNQKHRLLCEYKQDMMQKLFSQQLRFKADDGSEFGEWEDKKIGDLFKVTSGSTPLRSDNRFFENAEFFWVKTTDLNNSLITTTEEKISRVVLDETSIKILPKGTVFVAMYGGFNQIGRTGLLTMESACNQALSATYPTKNINPYFLLTYLNFKVKGWKSFAASSRKDPNITKSDVLAFPFVLMSLEEQTKIANFLSAIDQKIEVVAQQIEQAKTWKKGLLQQMFV